MKLIKTTLKKIMPASLYNYLRALNDYVRVIKTHHRGRKERQRTEFRNETVLKKVFKSNHPIKLELGAGARKMDGWISIENDLSMNPDLAIDLLTPLPIPDARVDEIYSSHVLEHFEYSDLLRLFSECFRVLVKGGMFKAAVPNARIYLDGYSQPDKFDPEQYFRYLPAVHGNLRIDRVNYMAYMAGNHRYLFDEENLVRVLVQAGFKNVRLRGMDSSLDIPQRDYESLYVEGMKP